MDRLTDERNEKQQCLNMRFRGLLSRLWEHTTTVAVTWLGDELHSSMKNMCTILIENGIVFYTKRGPDRSRQRDVTGLCRVGVVFDKKKTTR